LCNQLYGLNGECRSECSMYVWSHSVRVTCTSRHLLVLWPAEVRAVCCCHAVAGLFRCARRGGGAARHAHIVWNPAFSSIKVQYLCLAHVMAHGAASREVQFKSLRSLNDYCLLVLLHVSYIATAQPTTIIRMCVCESTSFTPVQCTLVGQFPSCNKDGCSFKCCQVEEPF